MWIFQDLSWILFHTCWSAILCLVTGVIYSIHSFTKKPKIFPPGPRGIPILGVAPFVGNRPEVTFAKWGQIYGDVVGFNLGRKPTIVLNSYEAIQEALAKNSKIFNNRPDNFIFTDVMHKKGITMNDYTSDYITERKFAQTSLSNLGFGKSAIENSVLEEAKYLLKLFGNKDVELNKHIKKSLFNCSGNIIAQVVIGKRYEFEDDEFKEIADGFDLFFKEGSLAYQMTMIMPWMRYIPPVRGSALAIRKGMKAVSKIMTRKINEHEKSFNPLNMRDFIDEYLMEMKEKDGETKGPYSKKMLDCMIRDLFGAGMETVQGTLIFSCLILANRPHMMKRIHDEIDKVVGRDGIPYYNLRERMPFCHAFLKEVMRYKTFAPLCIPHCTSEDIIFRGYFIPKNTTVLPNLYAVHNDPRNWNKPAEFNPDRHIDDTGRVTVSKYFMPFGMGPRMCIGRHLGEMELFIFFVTIFQRYDAIPTSRSNCKRPHVNENAIRTGLAMCPPPHTPVTLKLRSMTYY